ncbi:alpha/beta fold hydrolase [Mycobacterium asiaticum]|uniref:Esterase n=1 Tax=Mycobacterium asiaticum TaxID=1790 RepID=A0A1A3N1U5_MYCAS|nr:alpha/beta fold hydrolase [Mycobacterium asiaticum]OBK15320.1 esterase [Mycobacterium asiaticum]
METVEYAPGRSADVFGDAHQPTILLWHGMQTDARAAVRPLADLLAGHGAAVVAPDWNSHADDGGRADLLGSLQLAREHGSNADGIVLVGWSLGGAAAAGLTFAASHHDVVVAHTVCLAGAFMAPDPISGRELTELMPEEVGSPFTLLHGSADDAVPVAASREFAAALNQRGWPVEFAELAADHGSIAGAEYDAAADRYVPATGAAAQHVAADVAARIAAVIGH